jgi:hypothetical protein
MTSNSSDRLDRIEALVESNAKSIQALSDQAAEDRRARVRMYEAMADLASAQSGLASAQAALSSAQSAFYRRLDAQDELISTLSRRQGEIVQILKVLSDRESR